MKQSRDDSCIDIVIVQHWYLACRPPHVSERASWPPWIEHAGELAHLLMSYVGIVVKSTLWWNPCRGKRKWLGWVTSMANYCMSSRRQLWTGDMTEVLVISLCVAVLAMELDKYHALLLDVCLFFSSTWQGIRSTGTTCCQHFRIQRKFKVVEYIKVCTAWMSISVWLAILLLSLSC